MRRPFLPTFLLLLPLLAVAASGEGRLKAVEETHRFLQAEYDLASKPQVYFVFDLPAGKVSFKARGIAVAELPVQSVSRWGDFGGAKVRSLAGKESFFTPRRETVKIASQEPAAEPQEEKVKPESYELSALELSDMPRSFRLRLDDGTRITVRPAPEGFFSRLWWAVHRGVWHLTRPLISDWNFLHKKPYTEALLTLQEKDARLLYWSLTEGSGCLVVP